MSNKTTKLILGLILSVVLFFFSARIANAGCDFENTFTWGCDYGCSTFNEYWKDGVLWKCWSKYIGDGMVCEHWDCTAGSSPPGCGCFVGGTEVATKLPSDQAIENLKPGDIVSSFNPETGEISESQVAEVHKVTREGYFELETESGKKVKVTAEHPFLAIKANNFQLIDKLKNFLSHTLTFRLIISLRTKLGEVW